MYFLFAELIWPFNKVAIHPSPIQLNVYHYESFLYRRRTFLLGEGFYNAVTDKHHEYIIGIIAFGEFCPLMVPRANLANSYERVKVRIEGKVANATVPISNEDPINRQFFKSVNSTCLVGVHIEH